MPGRPGRPDYTKGDTVANSIDTTLSAALRQLAEQLDEYIRGEASTDHNDLPERIGKGHEVARPLWQLRGTIPAANCPHQPVFTGYD